MEESEFDVFLSLTVYRELVYYLDYGLIMDDDRSTSPWSLVGIAWNLGYMIAIPLVGCALLGRFVDKVFQSSPLFFLIGVLVAGILSTIIVSRKVSALMNDQNKK